MNNLKNNEHNKKKTFLTSYLKQVHFISPDIFLVKYMYM